MLSQVISRVVLVVALLIAWQAALLHPLQHVDTQGGLVHVPGKDKTTGSVCDALAALTACVADAPAGFSIFSSPATPLIFPQGAPRLAEAPPFLSQGPPTLL